LFTWIFAPYIGISQNEKKSSILLKAQDRQKVWSYLFWDISYNDLSAHEHCTVLWTVDSELSYKHSLVGFVQTIDSLFDSLRSAVAPSAGEWNACLIFLSFLRNLKSVLLGFYQCFYIVGRKIPVCVNSFTGSQKNFPFPLQSWHRN
jgi:hypothetical protein